MLSSLLEREPGPQRNGVPRMSPDPAILRFGQCDNVTSDSISEQGAQRSDFAVRVVRDVRIVTVPESSAALETSSRLKTPEQIQEKIRF